MKKRLTISYVLIVLVAIFMVFSKSIDVLAISQAEADSSPELILNQTKTGLITEPDGSLWYKFTITEPGYFRICMGPNSEAKEINWGWEAHIFRKGNLTAEIGKLENVSENKQSKWFAYDKDTFYVKVQNRSDNKLLAPKDSPFDLKVEFNKSTFWESEDNNLIKDADVISVNEDYRGTVYSSEDIDFFKYTVNEDGLHSFSFSPDLELNTSNDFKWGWDMTVYTSNMKKEVSSIKKMTATQNSAKVALKKGVYYIKIQANSKGDYFCPSGMVYNFSVNYNGYSKLIVKQTEKITKVKAVKKKTTINCKKINYASGYEVYRSTKAKKGFKKIGTTTAKSTTFVDKKAKANKVYYYKVRAFVKVNGKKYYSKYSPVKKVKAK